jgi:hypothetical protein
MLTPEAQIEEPWQTILTVIVILSQEVFFLNSKQALEEKYF